MNSRIHSVLLTVDDLFSRSRLFEIMRFGVVGTTAMMIHYGIYYALLSVVQVNVAFSLGYLISFLYNFTMTSYFTFRVKPSVGRFLRFATTHATNYVLQILLLNFFILIIGMDEKTAPVPVYAISIPVNYLLVRLAIKRKLS